MCKIYRWSWMVITNMVVYQFLAFYSPPTHIWIWRGYRDKCNMVRNRGTSRRRTVWLSACWSYSIAFAALCTWSSLSLPCPYMFGIINNTVYRVFNVSALYKAIDMANKTPVESVSMGFCIWYQQIHTPIASFTQRLFLFAHLFPLVHGWRLRQPGLQDVGKWTI